VDLFRPDRVIPNTLDPTLRGWDWLCIDEMFKKHLSREGMAIVTTLHEEVSSRMRDAQTPEQIELTAIAGEDNIELKNVEGGRDAQDAAGQWTTPDSKGMKKLQMMRDYLAGPFGDGINELLKYRGNGEIQTANEGDLERVQHWTTTGGYSHEEWSDEDTDHDDDDDDDKEGLTAHKLFAPNAEAEAPHTSSQPPSDDLRSVKATNVTLTKGMLPTPVTSPLRAWRPSTSAPPKSHSLVTRLPLPSGMESPLLDARSQIATTKKDLLLSNFSTKSITLKAPLADANTQPCELPSVVLKPLPSMKRTLVCSSTANGGSPKRQRLDSSEAASIISTCTSRNALVPVSPRRIARRQQRREVRADRNKIAERLSRARPDLVIPSYAAKSRQKEGSDFS
jgi:hypothetical protein